MASGIYNIHLTNTMKGDFRPLISDIKVILMNSSHSFDATDEDYSDIVANEISGVGYDAEGKSLSGKSVSGTSIVVFDANNVSWTEAEITASHCVLVDATNNNNLIASFDFGGENSVSGGIFRIVWDENGIINLTQ
jgi:hypothetical protein